MIRQSNTWQVKTKHAVATLVRRTRKRSVALAGLLAILGMSSVHAEKITYYVADAQGTVVATMNSQAAVTYTAAYRPYGKQAQGAAQTGPGYTGHVNDPATGLVYMQQRYYDPRVGRFLSPDPVAPTPDNIYNINRYVYAANNPIRYTDPDGRCIDGVTCGSMLSGHVEWRMSHPNAPPDGLEKAAFVGVGVMVGATLAPISPELAAGAKIVIRKVLSRATRDDTKHSISKNREQHIFRDKEGHLRDTPQNRETLQRVADDPKTTQGTDKYGNTWSSQQNKDGSQTWTQTRNGEIINGGTNQTPRQYNPETGLSRPVRPDKEVR